MQSYSQPSRVSVSLDADLIDWLDQLIDEAEPGAAPVDRTQVIEDAIRLWCQQQTHRRLQRSADLHRRRHEADETGWLV